MQSINLTNKKVLKLLNVCSDFIYTIPKDVIEKGAQPHSSTEGKENPDMHPASVEFLNVVMKNPNEFKFARPQDALMFDFNTNKKHIPSYVNTTILRLAAHLGVKHNALMAYYPPKGYIGWHHNCDAPGLNVLFTYSENGNGCFKYRDPETKKIVAIPDKKGWSAKVGYFNPVDSKGKDYLFWHAAETEDHRMTIAFVLGEEDVRIFWEKMIEQLETE